MSKQGGVYLKVIAIVLAVFLSLYAILSLLDSSQSEGYILEVASLCEVGDGLSVSGFVVRPEQILTGSESIMVYELSEGERVGGGQTVATGYLSATDRDNREKLSALTAQLAQLQAASDEINAGTTVLQDEDISALILSISQATARRELETAQKLAEKLQPMVLHGYVTDDDIESINRRITQLNSEISSLSQQTEESGSAVTAPEAGYFSHQADGYETVLTPDRLNSITSAELRAVKASPVPDNAVGRVITGQTWYYITQVPAETAARCTEGGYLTVNFPREALQGLRMVVRRVGDVEADGSCVLVLSYGKLMQEVTALREQTADIVFETNRGLYVPATAIYYIDNETGVFVLESAQAEWKEIHVLCQYGDGYLVEYDSSDTDNLWPGDEIILTSQYIEDGSVMRQ